MVQAIFAGIKTKTRRTSGLDEVNKEPDKVEFVRFQEYPDGTVRAIFHHEDSDDDGSVKCPYGKVGDILFVRENWRMKMWDFEDSEVRIQFTDDEQITFELPVDDDNAYEWMVKQYEKLVAKDIIAPSETEEEMMMFTGKKHPLSPSIHLPKYCSRIWLEVTDIKVERLKDINDKDAIAEGIQFYVDEHTLRPRYKDYLADASGYGHPDHDYPTVGVPVTSFSTLWRKINGEESWNQNPWVWVVSFKVLSTTGKPKELQTVENVH